MAIDIFDEYLSRRDKFTKALFKRPESLAKFLPYDEFIKKHNIFLNKDGSLGVVFKLDLIEHEPLSGDEIIDRVDITKVFFQLPNNCLLQVIHEQKPVSVNDKFWDEAKESYPYGSEVSEMILDNKITRLKELCKNDSDLRPLSRSTYFSIKYYPSNKNRKMYESLLKKGQIDLLNEVKHFVTDLRAFDSHLKNIEVAKSLKLKRLDADELISNLRCFFNPKEFYKRDFTDYNPNCSLSDQIIYKDLNLDYDSITREGLRTKTITLKNCPQYGLAGGMSGFLKLNFPFRICLNFGFPSRMSVKKSLNFKSFFLERTPSAEARRLKADLDLVQEKLANKDRCLNMTFNVVIEGETDEELSERTRSILSVFKNELDCEAIVENDIGTGLCLNTLPLMYSADSDFSTQRSIRILQSDAQNFLPIFDSYRGTGDPMQLFLSRENNLIPFSILNKNRSSNHSCVVADTGSGKSAFVLDCIQAYKRLETEPIIFSVEKRASSKMLCRYFDGELTEFSSSEPISFSPFRGIFDDAKVNFLTLLIFTAMELNDKDFSPKTQHSSVLNAGLKLADTRKLEESNLTYKNGVFIQDGKEVKNPICMDDVVNAIGSLVDDDKFTEKKGFITEILMRLEPFYGDGKYSNFFRGTDNQESSDCSFFVYDLDGLESDPQLQALVTLSVFAEIRRVISLKENLNRSGLIIFEEMGQLANNPTAAKYIVDFAETIRKLGFWLITIAPRPQNFFTSKAGQAAWETADNYFFLEMKPDSIKYLLENSEILNPVTAQIVKSVKTLKDHHADIFYTNKDGTQCGAFKFLRFPIDRWIAPTNSSDNHLAELAFEEAGNGPDALALLLEKYSEEAA